MPEVETLLRWEASPPTVLPFLIFLLCFLSCSALNAQALVFDRPAKNPQLPSIVIKDDKTLGDDFRIGKKGESWMIDRVRVWLLSPSTPGNLYSKLELYGGLLDPANNRQPKPLQDCDCHGLIRPLKSIEIPPGLHITPSTPLDFEEVRWSVPGGVDAQFGIRGGVRPGSQSRSGFLGVAAVLGEADHLRVFDSNGKFQEMYAAQPDARRIAVQVWAHLMIDVQFRSRGATVAVIIKDAPALEVKQIDRGSLKLGGHSTTDAKFEDTDRVGRVDLVLSVSRQSFLSANTPIVCLTGFRLDGVPFEGCAVAPK
jgi:hypothetical protein